KEARRRSHRGALGVVDRLERQPVDTLPALQACQALACSLQSLCGACNGLRVHGVGLDTRPRVRLVVPSAVDNALLVPYFDFESLTGPRLLGNRAECLEGVGLLLHLEGRRVAHRREGVDRLLPHEALELAGQPLDQLDVLLLAMEETFRG